MKKILLSTALFGSFMVASLMAMEAQIDENNEGLEFSSTVRNKLQSKTEYMPLP